MPPPLGFIRVQDRTQAQHDAHAAAMQHMVKFSLPPLKLAKGEKICLYDAWGDPLVVEDVGFKFPRVHQLTGSCVNCGGANAIFSTIAMQRLVSDKPTRAFLPFTWGNYAMSRHYMGDDGQGEGSMGSTFAKSLTVDGIRDWASDAGLPPYSNTDGISVLSSHVEMVWSSIHNPALKAVLEASKPHCFGSAAECKTVDDMCSFIGNGNGISFACDRYIGDAYIIGEGEDACVVGEWNGRGGHQQYVDAVWHHPNLGLLLRAGNNWPGNTYPRDPAGSPICGCWVKAEKVEAALTYDAEVYAYSHLPWIEAQPKVIEWANAI